MGKRTRLIVLGCVGAAALVLLGALLQARAVPSIASGAGPRLGADVSGESVSRAAQAQGADLPALAPSPKGIVVVGVGTAHAAPDSASITVGVQTEAQTAKEAQEKGNATMAAVVASIKSLGIPEKDIQTSGVGLWPMTERENRVTGYRASNSVTVQVQDVSKVGPVLDAAVAAGANTAGNVRFGLKDPSAAQRQALDAAAKDAQGKADAIAKALGVRIKAVDSAVEEVTGGPVPVAEALRAEFEAAGGMGVPVQPGELAVTTRLRITCSY